MREPTMASAPPDPPPSRSDAAALVAEAAHLHRCLFRRPLDERIAARYVRAHDHVQFARGVDVTRIVERRLDAEAIEYWLRRRQPANALTQKLRTLLYLLEIEAPYYRHFVRDRGTLLGSLPWLLLAPPRSFYKLVKGALLVRRHGLIEAAR